ncbi:MAG: ABC transporter permease, partial [Bacteroidia bacterium]|nr:ABC transporter permease [Bacteroidia bacterium]
MAEHWNTVEKGNPFNIKKILRDLFDYKDLIVLFFKRDIKSSYQQTILGPLWLIIQPVFTSIVFTIVFGNIAKIPTPANISPFAFYLLGLSFWNYFADCFHKITGTFVTNSSVFGKVYFPRLTVPVSVLLSGLFRFGIQFALFLAVFSYGFLFQGYSVQINMTILMLPVYLLLLSLFGLGLGLIISSFTTKYRDLTMLVGFGVQLLMYATPIAYPFFTIRCTSVFYKILLCNPLTGIIEGCKYAFTSNGLFSPKLIATDSICVVLVLILGIYIFSQVERKF